MSLVAPFSWTTRVERPERPERPEKQEVEEGRRQDDPFRNNFFFFCPRATFFGLKGKLGFCRFQFGENYFCFCGARLKHLDKNGELRGGPIFFF